MEGYQLKQIKENFGYFLRGKASQLPDIADIAAVADIWSSELNVRLANKPKPDIAHKYPSLSEYSVFGCRL